MTPSSGLREVVAGRTALGRIDGAKGRLLYCGYDAVELAERASFEETVLLLWNGELPAAGPLDAFRRRLASLGAIPPPIVALLRDGAFDADPMDALRTAVSALALFDPDAADDSAAGHRRKAERVVAAVPSIVAAFERLRRGEGVVEPGATGGLAARFLHALRGTPPDPLHARALDACLVLHAEHGYNASTFAARVTASTNADFHSAIVAGIATLKGPLHGGANRAVMEMLEEIGDPANAKRWFERAAASNRRVPGFGHAVYRVDDPRAAVLRRLAAELAASGAEPRWHAIAVALEPLVKAWKPLPVNVDFHSAAVYRSLGLAADLYPTIFAMSRVAGWAAHYFEQRADNRLIRPEAEYAGPDDRAFVPLERRGR